MVEAKQPGSSGRSAWTRRRVLVIVLVSLLAVAGFYVARRGRVLIGHSRQCIFCRGEVEDVGSSDVVEKCLDCGKAQIRDESSADKVNTNFYLPGPD